MGGNGVFKTYGLAILLAVMIAFAIRVFVVEAYRIPSGSMRPTLEPGDTIFVTKYPFGLRFPGNPKPVKPGREPMRGEVVVFSYPDERQREYIKRVVAVAGDRVAVKGGKVWLNGKLLVEPFEKGALCGRETTGSASYGVCWDPPLLEDIPELVVPAKSVFVLNDLRSSSNEVVKQRSAGVVPNQYVKGKAVMVWLSVHPRALGEPWFPKFRFDRIFKRIE